MLPVYLLGLFLLSSVCASPLPDTTETVKTFTLADGTVVKEVVKNTKVVHSSSRVVIKRSDVDSELSSMSGVVIIRNAGAPAQVKISLRQLYTLLRKHGYPFPADIGLAPAFGKNPNEIVTIYLDQLYRVLENVDKMQSSPPGRILVLLKTVINGGSSGPGGAGQPAGGKPGGAGGDVAGDSYLANTGVMRREKCDRGLIDETATGIKSTFNGAVKSVANVAGSSGVLAAVLHGASNLATHAVSGVDFAIQDAACGLGNIANEAASALDNGDIVGGVGKIGQEFFGGIGNMAEDLASQAAEGVGGAAANLFGVLQSMG